MKKSWKNVTHSEKQQMKQMVQIATPETPFSPEYAASYLGLSTATLQKWRCEKSNAITFIKVGRAVAYLKKDLDAFLQQNQYRCTANY